MMAKAWVAALVACSVLAACGQQKQGTGGPAEDDKSWTRYIFDLLPAIDACITALPDHSPKVTKAWPMNHGKAMVRIEDISSARQECLVDLGTQAVEKVERVADAERVPGEYEPVFFRGDLQPMVEDNMKLSEVKDKDGTIVGWTASLK